jgi:polysaccharide deacetylase 2 family uncharacterized protein YibQ
VPSRREKIIGASASPKETVGKAKSHAENTAAIQAETIKDPNQIDLLDLIDKKSNAKGSLWTLVVGFYGIVIVGTALTISSVVFDEVSEDNSAPISFASDNQDYVTVIEDPEENLIAIDVENIDEALPISEERIDSVEIVIADEPVSEPFESADEATEAAIASAEAEIVVTPEVLDGPKTVAPTTTEEIEPTVSVSTAKVASWQKNAEHWVADTNLPKIAIVIDDMGIVKVASDRLAAMQGPYTLAFLPYATGVPEQARMVSKAGHELIIHMPMEPKTTNADPGDNALLSNLTSHQFRERLEWNFSRFDGYVGINNHMGSRLTEDAGAMVQVMTVLKQKDLLFLDSLTSPNSVGASAAKAVGVPHISRDIFLDNLRSPAAILKQLRRTEAIAKKRGYAIAIGHPYPETLDVLARWRASEEAKDFILVPLSQLVSERSERAIVDADTLPNGALASGE